MVLKIYSYGISLGFCSSYIDIFKSNIWPFNFHISLHSLNRDPQVVYEILTDTHTYGLILDFKYLYKAYCISLSEPADYYYYFYGFCDEFVTSIH